MNGGPRPGPGDPAGALLALMDRLEPALAPEAVLAALGQAAARPDGRRRIAAAVTGQPELLTGEGARAPIPGVLRYISALTRAGATTVVEPPCPLCGMQRQLGNPVDGLRVCGGCRSKARALRCGRCGKVRSTARRDDGGKPICQNCWHRDPRSWKPCAECGSNRRVAAVTDAGPVCQSCRPGPDLPCSTCRSGDGGRIGISRATGTPVCQRCRKRWITCSRCGTGAPLKGGTLREPLCAPCLNPEAAGVLPPRDERLTALETWINQVIATLADPGHRQALRGYALWHQLRRLRGRLGSRPASRDQAKNVRDQVTAAAAFLNWLTAQGLTLASCTQAELDQWLTGTSSHLARSANFARWAVTRRHASGLTAPATRWTGPAGPLDQDRRWADARRLLHNGTYPADDRVAGLLVLLYAQKLTAITALTAQHVQPEDSRTLLRLGSRPIILPAPLDGLVAGLAARRRRPGSSLLEVPSPWLFPGRQPGTALTPDALGLRLHALGISPRQSRSTALLTLAAEVPAAILAKTLGIHVQVAIQWQKISAGDWAAYAADISHRHDTPGSAIAAGQPR